MRIEPPPSPPSAIGPIPQATATTAPPLDPPGVLVGSHGLRVMPVSGESVTPVQPNSDVVVLPKKTTPASRSRATGGPSWSTGSGEVVREPRKGQPFAALVSLAGTGTPSSAPIGAPAIQRAFDALAIARPISASTRWK